MKKQKMIGDMSEWAGMLKDFWRQVDDGSITKKNFNLFLTHQLVLEEDHFILAKQNFYKQIFNIDIDLSNVKISTRKKGFNRLLIRIPETSAQMLFDKVTELFKTWKWTDKSLDHILDHSKSQRTTKDGPYAIWVRDRQEADKELKNISANQIQKEEINTETLEERILHEIEYFIETKKHLDMESITLCSGSRFSDGLVPSARWFPGHSEFSVHYFSPDYADSFLRAREAVS